MAIGSLTVNVQSQIKHSWAFKVAMLFIRFAAWLMQQPLLRIKISNGKWRKAKPIFNSSISVDVKEVE